jgi:mRNA guanylyltransferase
MDPSDTKATPLERSGAIWAGPDLQSQFQDEVGNLLSRPPHIRHRFPGAQPVSFASIHLSALKQRDYFVCEKTDGERFLLWMTIDGPNQVVYLINRKNEYYYIPGFNFPHHENRGEFHVNTILDGELVEDKYPDGHKEVNFMVFDMLVVHGKSLMKRTLDTRLGYFKEQVLKPYKNQPAGKKGPFGVKDKEVQLAYGLEKMFGEVIPKVKELHGNDGLIFTCRTTEYVMGTDENILKWKPPEENTVDFLMRIVWAVDEEGEVDYDALPREFELWIHLGEERGEATYQRQGELWVEEDEWEKMKRLGIPLQDVIVECFQEEVPVAANGDRNGNGHANANGAGPKTRWRWHRFREDKTESNHVSVYAKVIESIEDRVTEADLIAAQGEIRDAWKKRAAK